MVEMMNCVVVEGGRIVSCVFFFFKQKTAYEMRISDWVQTCALPIFADIAQWPEARADLDGVLFDLGVSSPQLDVAERGFSFGKDGPLDMRMDPDNGQSAAEWLATAADREIAAVLWTYGEERQSPRFPRAIVARPEVQPLTRTATLAAHTPADMPRRHA